MKFIIFLVLSATSAFAHELPLGNYLKMQESLKNDDFKGAIAAHKVICEKELLHYVDDYKDCSKNFKNIDELRESFKKLSEVYIENADQKELKQHVIATCPMAKAKWIQKDGSIANPYYGKSMLECGEKI